MNFISNLRKSNSSIHLTRMLKLSQMPFMPVPENIIGSRGLGCNALQQKLDTKSQYARYLRLSMVVLLELVSPAGYLQLSPTGRPPAWQSKNREWIKCSMTLKVVTFKSELSVQSGDIQVLKGCVKLMADWELHIQVCDQRNMILPQSTVYDPYVCWCRHGQVVNHSQLLFDWLAVWSLVMLLTWWLCWIHHASPDWNLP